MTAGCSFFFDGQSVILITACMLWQPQIAAASTDVNRLGVRQSIPHRADLVPSFRAARANPPKGGDAELRGSGAVAPCRPDRQRPPGPCVRLTRTRSHQRLPVEPESTPLVELSSPSAARLPHPRSGSCRLFQRPDHPRRAKSRSPGSRTHVPGTNVARPGRPAGRVSR